MSTKNHRRHQSIKKIFFNPGNNFRRKGCVKKWEIIKLVNQIAGQMKIKIENQNEAMLEFSLIALKRRIHVKFSLKKNSLNRKGKEWENYTSSRQANFKIKPGKTILTVRKEVVRYFNNLLKGFYLEDETEQALERLKEKGIILSYHRGSRQFDRKAVDFVVRTTETVEFPLQVKSSPYFLKQHQESHPEIAGFYYRVTKNQKKDVAEIQFKLKNIISSWAKGEILFT